MDSHQSTTNNKRKRRSIVVSPLANHTVLTSEAQDIDTTKRPKQDSMDPLKIEGVLEIIFGFLDVQSIKNARQVNPLWRAEGAKMLMTKCYVQIPLNLRAGPSTRKNNNLDKFKTFLAYKSRDTSMIPNITVRAARDVEWWKYLGVLGQQVKSLKLKTIDWNAEMLANLLDLLPNLNYLNIEECQQFADRKVPVFKALTSAMSKTERVGKPLVISSINLQRVNVAEMKEIEKLSQCSNIMIEDLNIAMVPYLFENIPNVETRRVTIISKLLSTSQNTLKKLTLKGCEMYLSQLEFPCMTQLTHIGLFFDPYTPAQFSQCKFSPNFQFSVSFPKLTNVVLEYDGTYGKAINFFEDLLENTGIAPSVRRLEYCDNYLNANLDPCFEVFPDLQEFETFDTACSQQMLQSIWKNGKNLQRLGLEINFDFYFEDFADLDSAFTGFSSDTVNTMNDPETWTSFTSEEVENLRIEPSILNLKELKWLKISLSGDCEAENNAPARILATTGQFAFKLLSSISWIIISVLECEPSPEYVMAGLADVTKVPHVIPINMQRLKETLEREATSSGQSVMEIWEKVLEYIKNSLAAD